MVRSNGETILALNTEELTVAKIHLVESVTLPSWKGRILKARLTGCQTRSPKDLLFQPSQQTLQPLGVCMEESLISPPEGDNTVWVPVENYQGVPVHLEAGSELGVVTQLTEAVVPCEAIDIPLVGDHQDISFNAPVKALDNTPERCEKVIKALELDNKLSSKEVVRLRDVLSEFADVFALDDSELGCIDTVKHSIDTCGHPPIKQQPYWSPAIYCERVSEMIDKMREQGVVQPSSSLWASPIVLVPKKDGSQRFCVDYRWLNAITRKDVYPLPRIEDILTALGEARYFLHWTLRPAIGKCRWTTMRGRRVLSPHIEDYLNSLECHLGCAMPRLLFREFCRRCLLTWSGVAVLCFWTTYLWSQKHLRNISPGCVRR